MAAPGLEGSITTCISSRLRAIPSSSGQVKGSPACLPGADPVVVITSTALGCNPLSSRPPAASPCCDLLVTRPSSSMVSLLLPRRAIAQIHQADLTRIYGRHHILAPKYHRK